MTIDNNVQNSNTLFGMKSTSLHPNLGTIKRRCKYEIEKSIHYYQVLPYTTLFMNRCIDAILQICLL